MVAEQVAKEIPGAPLAGKFTPIWAGAVTLAGNPAGPAGSAVGTTVRERFAPGGMVTTPAARVMGWSQVTCPDWTVRPAKLPAGAVASKGLTAIQTEPATMVALVGEPKWKIESGTTHNTVPERWNWTTSVNVNT